MTIEEIKEELPTLMNLNLMREFKSLPTILEEGEVIQGFCPAIFKKSFWFKDPRGIIRTLIK